ncbi:MAG: hypothetical protein MUO27_06265 [Sedimentisphaerales bacterium]|nr:hypothetical protein [Sedimentisphaerales bacterium]
MNNEFDVLSYQQRRPRIHILTLDRVLADDIYERLRYDTKTRFYEQVVPKQTQWQERIDEIEAMAGQTTSSRLLIMDVRKITLPKLQQAYNKIIGYNRKDLNKLCFTVLLGDGPLNLFQAGKSLDVFVPYLADQRVDYNPAVFFFDPFIHYEPEEIDSSMDDLLLLPKQLPRRFAPYFPEEGVTVDSARRFFRAAEQNEAVKKQRLKVLAALYLKRIAAQFPEDKEHLRALLSKNGAQLASEKLNLYPVFFEDWVHDLMQRAANPPTPG